jgi:hypothetical protein
MHILFVVGILMAAGFLMEKIVLNYKNLKGSLVVKKFALVFLALVLVIFINPYGLRGAIFSFQVNSDKSFPVYPAEITTLPDALKAAPGLNNIPGLIFYYVAILLAISFIVVLVFRFRKKQFLFSNNIIFYFAASLGSGALGYFVIRGLPMFGLIFLPVISENLNKPFIALKEWLENKWSLKKKNIIGIIFVLLLILSIVWLIIFSQQKIMDSGQEGLGLENWSLSSEKFFKDNNIKGPIFNDTDIGSYLIYYFYPKQKVFTDNRFGDAYSAHFFADIYLPLLNDDAKWQEGLARYNFNAIFFYHYDAAGDVRDFLYKRIYDKDWAWVYADSYAVILIRRTPENKGIIDKFEITKENVAEKLKYLSDSKYSQDQIAAADIFNLIGRFDLSMPAYLKFVSRHPGNGKVWMVLGKTELTKSDQADSNPYLAAIYLERAISEGWKTWESYSYLALAYYRTGQLDRAKAAVKKELSIDPGNQDGEKWLGTFANQAANSQ